MGRVAVLGLAVLLVTSCSGREPAQSDAGLPHYYDARWPDARIGPDAHILVCRDASLPADAAPPMDGGSDGECNDPNAPALATHPAVPSSHLRPTTTERTAAHEIWCNLVYNIGCGPNERCGIILLERGAPAWVHFDCVPQGTQTAGESCTTDGEVACGMTGISDCIGTTDCVDGVCRQFCDTKDGQSTCDEGYLCEPHPARFHFQPLPGLGVCLPATCPTGTE